MWLHAAGISALMRKQRLPVSCAVPSLCCVNTSGRWVGRRSSLKQSCQMHGAGCCWCVKHQTNAQDSSFELKMDRCLETKTRSPSPPSSISWGLRLIGRRVCYQRMCELRCVCVRQQVDQLWLTHVTRRGDSRGTAGGRGGETAGDLTESMCQRTAEKEKRGLRGWWTVKGTRG